MYSFFSICFSLFLLMDPMGNTPIYVALLKDLSLKRQFIVILREHVIALGIIVFFAFLGEHLLTLLKISQETVMIAGGIILFIIALHMIFPPEKDSYTDRQDKEEPFIVPLAIPLIAGPSVLAAVMIYSHKIPLLNLFGAITVAWFFSMLILFSSPILKKVLKTRGLTALERLMGLLLTLIAVQMFLEGVGIFLYVK